MAHRKKTPHDALMRGLKKTAPPNCERRISPFLDLFLRIRVSFILNERGRSEERDLSVDSFYNYRLHCPGLVGHRGKNVWTEGLQGDEPAATRFHRQDVILPDDLKVSVSGS